MKKMQIHLFSQAIQTGKTTSLMHFVNKQQGCTGILSPVINGKRHFYSISTGEYKLMEASEGENEQLEIGKYKFSQAAFDWAIQHCQQDLVAPQELFILDEIGPLELRGEGLSDLLLQLLAKQYVVTNLLLVVRSSMLESFVAHFGLDVGQLKTWKI